MTLLWVTHFCFQDSAKRFISFTEGIPSEHCNGVFVAVGSVPDTKPLANLVKTDKNGYIIADESGKTSADGIFAGGDIRTKALRQVVTAVSDGANCVISAEKYLDEKQ